MDADPRQYENIVIDSCLLMCWFYHNISGRGECPMTSDGHSYQFASVFCYLYWRSFINDIHKIVRSYLVHNCFKDTLESFIACTGVKQPVDHLEDMEKRKRIFHFALDGNASKAIELTEEFAPGLLEENKDLHFDLLSLHFVELVCSRKIDEALGFAQSKFTPFGKEQKYVEKLEDFMALLAYEEPEKSPMFHLLSSEHRHHVADSLNRAILAHTKLPSYSEMERLIQQTTVVRQCLSQEFGKDGQQLFSLKDFLKS
ncbi:glucose-induced degradation protein 8 homolog [Sesamum indicum]|uniref:Glucose-induced degradation protein 8 homolog n=1 Tax=Sesamum indicum TaxID=4182 RepID=A0A6I9TIE8_SESIN|nr:glucose-induced degradation protein 8 homolog [Sesamum indicum]